MTTSDPVYLAMLEEALRHSEARDRGYRLYLEQNLLRYALLLEKFSPKLGADWDADLAHVLETIPRGRAVTWETLLYAVRAYGLEMPLRDDGTAPAQQIRARFWALFGESHEKDHCGMWCEAVGRYTRELLDYGVQEGLLVRNAGGYRRASQRAHVSQRHRQVERRARSILLRILTETLPGVRTPRTKVSTVENTTLMALTQGKYRVTPPQMKARLRELINDEDVIKAAMAIYKGATA